MSESDPSFYFSFFIFKFRSFRIQIKIILVVYSGTKWGLELRGFCL